MGVNERMCVCVYVCERERESVRRCERECVCVHAGTEERKRKRLIYIHFGGSFH